MTKKTYFFSLFIALFIMGIGVVQAKKIERNPVIAYATDPNAKEVRAYALYNDYEENDPWASARNYARGELAQRIATLVTSAMDSYRNSYQTTENGKHIKTASNKSETNVRSYAQELLRGAREAKTEAYRQKDGTLTVYVCMEITLDALMNNMHRDQRILQALDDVDDSQSFDFEDMEQQEAFKKALEQANKEH